MEFLANENFPRPSIKFLRENSFLVSSIAETSIGISDHDVIQLAIERNQIILTFDKDYGEIIFKENLPEPPSVIFFRIKGKNPFFASQLILEMLEQGVVFEKHFTVVDESGIRQRAY
jgi:predicted nuclease of predicted toxin-antitoxin system